jgi:hypothetical protein
MTSKKKEVQVPAKAVSKPVAKKGITVQNLTKTWFVQPATGVLIDAGQTKLLEEDGWVKLQVDAKFFKVVE